MPRSHDSLDNAVAVLESGNSPSELFPLLIHVFRLYFSRSKLLADLLSKGCQSISPFMSLCCVLYAGTI